MGSIDPFLRDDSFGPELKRAMDGAFRKACQAHHIDELSILPKQIIADRIVQAAREGVQDAELLHKQAIAALARLPDDHKNGAP